MCTKTCENTVMKAGICKVPHLSLVAVMAVLSYDLRKCCSRKSVDDDLNQSQEQILLSLLNNY